ncbi:aminotransferase class V-fold PLP-dependent enzyme [Aureibacillus halotolerans]|uniref:aminotransferase class V-fold PLP-dependent enzyme n=1 Tax=Aureibacillus halotolerans TaxID=1508390 RepID=UPI00141522A9|nr:aminotransferase class V-fold PLP-dependent enzyme [Aureibacillus halotolerans]
MSEIRDQVPEKSLERKEVDFMIYLDHAATSFPKPPAVIEAVTDALTNTAANPGRGSYALARQADTVVDRTRQAVKTFFSMPPSGHVLFFPHATGALNQVIKGFPFEPGDHVITTSLEHNAVRRPLGFLEADGMISVSKVPWQETTDAILEKVEDALRLHTKMLIVTHGSNVTGDIWPIQALGELAEAHGICFVVDASQTAGFLSINMETAGMDFLVAPGHKGLLGPQGTGILLAKSDAYDLLPQQHGGTGDSSESMGLPQEWPGRFESGTMNVAGIAGLYAGLKVLQEHGLDELQREKQTLTTQCVEGLRAMNHVTVYGHRSEQIALPVVLFSIADVDAQEAAMILDQSYEIAVRAGLHCAPDAHKWAKTPAGGGLRASFGWSTSKDDIEALLKAVSDIIQAYHGA